MFPAAELRKDLFLRLFTDRAGVDQDDVRLVLAVGQFEPVGCRQDVRHFVRVVLVHLAAVSLDIELAFHRLERCAKEPRRIHRQPIRRQENRSAD